MNECARQMNDIHPAWDRFFTPESGGLPKACGAARGCADADFEAVRTDEATGLAALLILATTIR